MFHLIDRLNLNLKIKTNGKVSFDLIFVLLIIFLQISSMFLNINVFDQSIRTNFEIYYDFSSSWRIHIDKLSNDQQIYKDFEYAYPPLGLILTHLMFKFLGGNIFLQSLVTFSIFSLSIIYLYKIADLLITDFSVKALAFFTSFLFLHSLGQEISLGGNPFPLWLGFTIFLIAAYSFLKDQFVLGIFFALIAASCKHEFWVPAFLMVVIGFYLTKQKILVILILFLVILVNYLNGYNSFEIITGLGRMDWARGQFHWLPASISFFLLFSGYFLRNNRILLMLATFIACCLIAKFVPSISVIYLPFFLFSFVLLTSSITNSKMIFVLMLLLVSIQFRRGFEWPDPIYIALVPIFLGLIFSETSKEADKTLAWASILQLLTISIFLAAFLVRPYVFSSNYTLHNTAIGKIYAPKLGVDFEKLKAALGGKTLVCIPFCSGISLFTGSENIWPLQGFYRRDRVKAFDYYEILKSGILPDAFVIDSSLIKWNSYPDKQNSFLKWSLDRKTIDYREEYSEVFETIENQYSFYAKNGPFEIYTSN